MGQPLHSAETVTLAKAMLAAGYDGGHVARTLSLSPSVVHYIRHDKMKAGDLQRRIDTSFIERAVPMLRKLRAAGLRGMAAELRAQAEVLEREAEEAEKEAA